MVNNFSIYSNFVNKNDAFSVVNELIKILALTIFAKKKGLVYLKNYTKFFLIISISFLGFSMLTK